MSETIDALPLVAVSVVGGVLIYRARRAVPLCRTVCVRACVCVFVGCRSTDSRSTASPQVSAHGPAWAPPPCPALTGCAVCIYVLVVCGRCAGRPVPSRVRVGFPAQVARACPCLRFVGVHIMRLLIGAYDITQ